MKRFSLCVLCVLLFSLAVGSQSILTADGLAAFVPPAATGGGGSDDLTGIGIRYVADDVSGTDGTAVSAWADSGGGGYNLAQATSGNKPVIRVSAVNSHRAVEFDGVNDFLSVSLVPPSALGTTTASAAFIVMKQAGTQNQNTALSTDNTTPINVFASYSDSLIYDNAGTSGSQRLSVSQPVGWDDAWHIIECHRSGTSMSILVDGVSIGTGSGNGVNFSQSGTFNLYIGSYLGVAVWFKGQIAEVRVYNGDKDSTSSSNIRGALKTTYGTP